MGWDVKSITEAEQVEPVTDEDVVTTEQEAAEAEAEIGRLEERVLAGDETVTPEQIEKQRGLSRFAKLRAEAAARKAARSKQAERLKRCDALRQEIEAHSTGVGEQLAKALRKAEAALTAVYELEVERNRKVGEWRARAHDLGVPEHRSPFAPPAEHAHLGLEARKIIAGRRRLDNVVDVEHWVGLVVARAKEATTRHGHSGTKTTADPFEYAVKVDAAEETEPPQDVEFWQNVETGGIWQMGVGRGPVDDPKMRQISRREAERATW